MDFQQHRKSFLRKKKISPTLIFSLYRSRRPVPSLTNPMGNGNATTNTLILGNGNLPISQTKKSSSLSTPNNFFSFLPSSSTTAATTSNQNKYNNIPTMSNPLQRTPAMTNFIPTQNGQSPPPPPHMSNGNDIESNFPSINVSVLQRETGRKVHFLCVVE